MKHLLAAITAAALLAGCEMQQSAGTAGSDPHASVRVAGAASESERAALLDRLKSLEGEWLIKDEQGQMVTGSVYKVSSNGSVIREIMFPGSDHEMTNMYHMDGSTLVMTHYCAKGNQPRMRSVPTAEPNTIHLKFDGVTNLAVAEDYYMGDLKLTLVDQDHLVQEWTSFIQGKPTEHNARFELTRKR
jgi:hypothetical protein